jgi:ribosomal protein S8
MVDRSIEIIHTSIMKTLKDILANYGYINSAQLAEIAEHFPHMKVVIKWGGLPRDRLPAYQAIETIERVERENLDYCREVFLCGKDCDNLRTALHIAA